MSSERVRVIIEESRTEVATVLLDQQLKLDRLGSHDASDVLGEVAAHVYERPIGKSSIKAAELIAKKRK